MVCFVFFFSAIALQTDDEEVREMAWVERGLDEEEEAEEKKTVLRVIWTECVGPSHPQIDLCTVDEFVYTYGLLDVTYQWKN